MPAFHPDCKGRSLKRTRRRGGVHARKRRGSFVERLEPRIALTIAPPTVVSCDFGTFEAGAAAPDTQPAVALAPLDQTFKLHSRPSATKTIYLDFTGHTTKGTSWNDGGTIVTPAYDVDKNPSSFSDAELRNVQDVWARVVEDYSPFDVNVTTEEPALDDLRKVGAGDSRWGIRVVIGENTGGLGGGGIAYLGSFNWNSDTPCFVFPELLGNSNKNIAEAVSHEVGHTLGLDHDGRSSPSEDYYQGHGSGATSWAPIMGVGYSRQVVQWSKGEYANANNTQDDLAIIVGAITNSYVPQGNGFGYRPDDHGNSFATATKPAVAGGMPVTIAGVVERSNDIDVFEFTTLGKFQATISPAAISPDLDILAEIWDAVGTVLFASNPLDALTAAFDVSLTAGTYFLAIQGTGKGDATTGYTKYASLGQYSAAVTIEPAIDPLLSIAESDALRAEGNTGGTPFTFTVTRRGDITKASSVAWAVTGSGNSPATADDFTSGILPSGSVTFAGGETSKTVTVSVAGDTAAEADEGFTVVLSAPTGATLVQATAQGVIRNDDASGVLPVLTIAADGASKAEGNAGPGAFTFIVTRAGDLSVASSAVWRTAGSGAALADAVDFMGGVFPGGIVSFAAGESQKTLTVPVRGDMTFETDETFTVTLSAPAAATLGTPATAEGTIRNDDDPPPVAGITIRAVSANKGEGDSGTTPFTFVISRPEDTIGAPATVVWTVTGSGTNPATPTDFAGGELPAGVAEFAARQTSVTITVAVTGDRLFEQDERFTVTLSEPDGGDLGSPAAAVGVICNDDKPATTPPATLSIGPTIVDRTEGNSGSTAFTFTVTRSGDTAAAVSAAWSVSGAGDYPASGADFSGGSFPSGTVSFAAGETSKTIVVAVAGDTDVEPNERFAVTLANPTNALLGTPLSAVGAIVNDDQPPPPPAPTLSIGPAVVERTEGNSGSTTFTFTVTRSGDTAAAVSAAWSVSGAGDYPASSADFSGGSFPSGTVSFAAGETSKTIAVAVAGDTTAEPNERFAVTLANPTNASLGTPLSAVGVIVNDDQVAPPPPTVASLTIGPAVVERTEGNSGATVFSFTVTRSGDASGASSAAWSVVGSGASPAGAADFAGATLPTGVVTFAAGVTTRTIVVEVAADTAVEADERFVISLSAPAGAVLGDATTATGVIVNDDQTSPPPPPPGAAVISIAASQAALAEGNTRYTTFTFTVTRSGSRTGSAAVRWAVSGSGSAPAAADDFVGGVLPSGTVAFASGATRQTVKVLVRGDVTAEADERFVVTLSSATNATIGTGTAASTIRNDDGLRMALLAGASAATPPTRTAAFARFAATRR